MLEVIAVCETFSNPDGAAKMWKQGRIELGKGPIMWSVWGKGSELKAKIHRLKGMIHAGDEWHMYDSSHKAWYYLIPSSMKGRIAKILGITGVVDRKRQIEAKRRAGSGWGKATRFSEKARTKSSKKEREPVEVGCGVK